VLQAVIGPLMKALFRSPEQAATPVLYLAAAPELAGETGWYLHLMRRKAVSELASDSGRRLRLREKGAELAAPWLETAGS
jgi:hypothetical protein